MDPNCFPAFYFTSVRIAIQGVKPILIGIGIRILVRHSQINADLYIKLYNGFNAFCGGLNVFKNQSFNNSPKYPFFSFLALCWATWRNISATPTSGPKNRKRLSGRWNVQFHSFWLFVLEKFRSSSALLWTVRHTYPNAFIYTRLLFVTNISCRRHWLFKVSVDRSVVN